MLYTLIPSDKYFVHINVQVYVWELYCIVVNLIVIAIFLGTLMILLFV